jgi:hypothetical protein
MYIRGTSFLAGVFGGGGSNTMNVVGQRETEKTFALGAAPSQRSGSRSWP